MRYPIKSDWVFYLFLASYAYLIVSMTARLWFAGGVNVFASYTDTPVSPELILEANQVYWSKTWFLFGTWLLYALRVDFRAAIGLGAIFWSGSLIAMFGWSPNLIGSLVMGIVLVALQIKRGEFLTQADG